MRSKCINGPPFFHLVPHWWFVYFFVHFGGKDDICTEHLPFHNYSCTPHLEESVADHNLMDYTTQLVELPKHILLILVSKILSISKLHFIYYYISNARVISDQFINKLTFISTISPSQATGQISDAMFTVGFLRTLKHALCKEVSYAFNNLGHI